MAGYKTQTNVKDWARLNPYAPLNGLLIGKVGPGLMPVSQDG